MLKNTWKNVQQKTFIFVFSKSLTMLAHFCRYVRVPSVLIGVELQDQTKTN